MHREAFENINGDHATQVRMTSTFEVIFIVERFICIFFLSQDKER